MENMAAPGPDFATAGLPERSKGAGAVPELRIVNVRTAGPAAAEGKLTDPPLESGLLHPVGAFVRDTLIICASREPQASIAMMVNNRLNRASLTLLTRGFRVAGPYADC